MARQLAAQAQQLALLEQKLLAANLNLAKHRNYTEALEMDLEHAIYQLQKLQTHRQPFKQ